MRHGIIMEIQTKNAFVFTNDCSLIRVAARKDMFVGQSIPLPDPDMKTTMKTAFRQRRWLVPALAAACLVLLLCTGVLLSALFILPQAGPVFLSLDINPSLELTLDAKRVVTAVQPMNSDAWQLLRQTELTGLGYEEAISRWVALVRENYPQDLEDLLITAVLSRRDRDFADQIMALNGPLAGEKLAALKGLDVRVLYTSDPEVKVDADANDLSIGRQMLLARARQQDPAVNADAFRTSPLKNLLPLLLSGQSVKTTETGTAASPTTSVTEKPIETRPTEAATETTVEETTPAVTQATTKATTKATTAAPTWALTATSNSAGWQLQWTVSPAGKELAYYKVVISQSVSNPKYPAQGYLTAISDRTQNQCQVNNSKKYNGGDFGGYLTPGQSYYVGITYVYSDSSKVYSSVKKLTYNGPAYLAPTAAAAAAFNPNLTASTQADGWHLVWDICPAGRELTYYKVVISSTDSQPQYPDNGYLVYFTNAAQTTCLVNNATAYNGGDIGGYLSRGKTYYVAVTYVFKDGSKITSTVRSLTYNGPAGP